MVGVVDRGGPGSDPQLCLDASVWSLLFFPPLISWLPSVLIGDSKLPVGVDGMLFVSVWPLVQGVQEKG